MKPYITAYLSEENFIKPQNRIAKLGKEIHKSESRIWRLEKSLSNVRPYCGIFKTLNRPMEIITEKRKTKSLRAERDALKAKTPKHLWYPKRKYCGRYNNREEDVKTMIMKEAFKAGFNVKSIAGYFGRQLPTIYRRIGVKKINNS